jgi:hypothetical protein
LSRAGSFWRSESGGVAALDARLRYGILSGCGSTIDPALWFVGLSPNTPAMKLWNSILSLIALVVFLSAAAADQSDRTEPILLM